MNVFYQFICELCNRAVSTISYVHYFRVCFFSSYDITYTSSNNSCGGNITGDHGSVYSKFYPQVIQQQ